jgi:hypothetical protein
MNQEDGSRLEEFRQFRREVPAIQTVEGGF